MRAAPVLLFYTNIFTIFRYIYANLISLLKNGIDIENLQTSKLFVLTIDSIFGTIISVRLL